MLITPTNPPEWDSVDAVNLKQFLDSQTGQRWLGHLLFQAPHLLDGSDVNKTLVASGAVKGYTMAVENAISMTVQKPETPKPKDNYPSLDDDSAWKDLENSGTD